MPFSFDVVICSYIAINQLRVLVHRGNIRIRRIRLFDFTHVVLLHRISLFALLPRYLGIELELELELEFIRLYKHGYCNNKRFIM